MIGNQQGGLMQTLQWSSTGVNAPTISCGLQQLACHRPVLTQRQVWAESKSTEEERTSHEPGPARGNAATVCCCMNVVLKSGARVTARSLRPLRLRWPGSVEQTCYG